MRNNIAQYLVRNNPCGIGKVVPWPPRNPAPASRCTTRGSSARSPTLLATASSPSSPRAARCAPPTSPGPSTCRPTRPASTCASSRSTAWSRRRPTRPATVATGSGGWSTSGASPSTSARWRRRRGARRPSRSSVARPWRGRTGWSSGPSTPSARRASSARCPTTRSSSPRTRPVELARELDDVIARWASPDPWARRGAAYLPGVPGHPAVPGRRRGAAPGGARPDPAG